MLQWPTSACSDPFAVLLLLGWLLEPCEKLRGQLFGGGLLQRNIDLSAGDFQRRIGYRPQIRRRLQNRLSKIGSQIFSIGETFKRIRFMHIDVIEIAARPRPPSSAVFGAAAEAPAGERRIYAAVIRTRIWPRTNDVRVAVEEGATMIRVGSGLYRG